MVVLCTVVLVDPLAAVSLITADINVKPVSIHSPTMLTYFCRSVCLSV